MDLVRPMLSDPHLLLAAVCSLRPLGGATERCAVITEVTGWVHLVLQTDHRSEASNTHRDARSF